MSDQITTSVKLSDESAAQRILALTKALGLEFHKESTNGQTYTRVQIGKQISANPEALLQNVGAFVRFNLPGDFDNIVVDGVNAFMSLGNSAISTPSTSS